MPLRALPPSVPYIMYTLLYICPSVPRIPTKKLLCGLCGFARASFSATTSPDGAESSVTPD